MPMEAEPKIGLRFTPGDGASAAAKVWCHRFRQQEIAPYPSSRTYVYIYIFMIYYYDDYYEYV